MSSNAQNPFVLIVEDESVIALDIEREFQSAAMHVLCCGTIPLALREITAAARRPDCAVVDLMLQGELSFAVIDALDERDIPFVIATACDTTVLPAKHRSRPFVRKPYAPAALLCVVAGTLLDRRPIRL